MPDATHPPFELPRRLPLVGRGDDLARLYRLFGHETRVEPMVLLSGDAGVGKSRVAEALEREADRRDWTVATGRAYPVETGMPYSLLSDAFLPILQEMDEATLTVLTRGTSGDLRQLFPALGPPDPTLETWDPGDLRTRLYWSFTEFIKRLAERTPLLIVAEDLHWADASSLSLLHFLARQLQGEPIRILATASHGYGEYPESLVRLERSLGSQGILARQELLPLDRGDTEDLLQAVFQVGGTPMEEFARHLFDWTRGNPYFLEETLKTLVHRRILHQRDGIWFGWEARDLDLPGSVRDALLLRFNALSDSARQVAELVAVCGGRASVRLLGALDDIDPADLPEAVEELSRQSVIDEREDDRDLALELRHPMLRESLYRNLSATRRQLLHRMLAEGLEGIYREGAASVDQLAYHFARGGPSGVDFTAARYLVKAGRAALMRHANREAVAYLEAAVERYPSDEREVDGHPDGPSRAEVQTELARGLARLGRYVDAGTRWHALLEASRDRGDRVAAAEALRHLGLLAFWGGRQAAALDFHERALEELGDEDESALEARILLAAGVALQELGRPDEARARIEECLTLARDLDDPMLLGRGHRALALLFTWIGRADDARRHGWQAVEMADRAGDPYVRFWGRWALSSLEGLTGNTEEMRRLMGQAGQVADELRSPVLRLWTAELEVEYLFAVGDWDGALAQGERAIALATNLSQTSLLPRLLVWTATVYVGRGDLKRARELVDRAWTLAGLDDDSSRRGDVHVVVPAHIGRAACLLAEGRWDEAIEVGRAGVEIADAAGYVFWSLHLLLPIVAEALIRARRLDEAADVGRRMREEGDRIGHRLAHAWADACDAIVRWVSGDVEEGLRLLQGAAEALDAIPLRYDAARVRRQLAGRMAEVGRRDDALAELRTVHDAFGELGAQPELDAVRDMFRELGVRPPSRIEAEGTADLTAREWDVANRVAKRMSNKAIAKDLGISPRTVTTHLSNIYRKLGIGRRGELVDLVREGRLPASPSDDA